MKSLKIITAICLSLSTCYAQIPNFNYAFGMGGQNNNSGLSIVIDGSKNTFVTGHFSGIADFDPSNEIANINSDGQGIFVAKYDCSGNYNWAFKIGAGGGEIGYGITTDNEGNVLITGQFSGPVDFDPSSNTALLTTQGSNIFVAKYSNNGQYLWAFKIEGVSSTGKSIITDSQNNIILTGRSSGTADFDPSSNVININNANGNTFLAKYSPNGQYFWAFGIEGSSSIGNSVAIDNTDNIYLAGEFWTSADFNPSINVNMLTSQGGGDSFIAKYSSGGLYLWAYSFGGSIGNDYCNDIEVDISGNVIVTGRFIGTVDFDPSNNIAEKTSPNCCPNAFIVKYNTDGQYIFGFNISTNSSGANSSGLSLDTDNNSNIYVTGFFGSTCDFDPSTITNNLISFNTSHDIFVAKYNSGGGYIWANKIGGGSTESGNSIAVSSDGNINLTGVFGATVDFNPPTNKNITATSQDIFVAKWGFNFISNPFTSVSIIPEANGKPIISNCNNIGHFKPLPNQNDINEIVGKSLLVESYVDDNIGNYNNNPYLKRHFDLKPIEPLATDQSYQFTMYFKQSDFDSFNASSSVKLPINSEDAEGYLSNLIVWQTHGIPTYLPSNPGNYSGGAPLLIPSLSTTKLWNSSLNCWEVTVNTTNFSGFFITAQGATALPVKMVSLNAKAENVAVKIYWETSSESNAQEFEIERSADAKTFVKIGEITANGNSDENIKYSYTDEYPYEGLNCYRLKQFDWDGKFEYSKIIATNFEKADKIKIFPNPVENVLQISTTSKFEIDEVNILDELGRKILVQKNSRDNINTTTLPKGKYYIHFRFLDGKSTTKSFLKN